MEDAAAVGLLLHAAVASVLTALAAFKPPAAAHRAAERAERVAHPRWRGREAALEPVEEAGPAATPPWEWEVEAAAPKFAPIALHSDMTEVLRPPPGVRPASLLGGEFRAVQCSLERFRTAEPLSELNCLQQRRAS